MTTEVPRDAASPSVSDDKSCYIFTATQDWFSFNIDTWRILFSLVSSPQPRVLEIGSWEGRSAVFLLNELCGSSGSITCIDHFDLFQTEAGQQRHERVLHNLELTGKTYRVMPSFSVPALMTLLQEEMANTTEPGFDWIYVDGSHEADDTFLDAELVWRLAREGAIIVFDDYKWDKEPEDSVHHPKRGIDAFMLLHKNEFEILSSSTQYQIVLRKTTPMRIGFLVQGVETSSVHRSAAFGYDIHIALVIDSSFAMPAAVTMQSILKHTPGRITFYILDVGLSATDRERLSHLIVDRDEVTIVFLSMPRDHPLSDKGAVWAKLLVLEAVPVERILYLDADLLIRSDLRPLWETDLHGKPLGAAVDIGHPMGHAGIVRGRYFNAGVLLFDLAKARATISQLFILAGEMLNSEYKDQDALNVHFRGEWSALDLVWNAQGLGTYAENPSPERAALYLERMRNDPAIVHFSGPVNPSVAEVLNPFVQPYTAKPWGYAGAPGHPFAEEWWNVVNETPWKGYRASQDYARCKAVARERVIEAATEALKVRTNF